MSIHLSYFFQSLKSQLLLLDPRQQADQRDNDSHDDSPQLDVQGPCIKTSLRGHGDRCEAEDQQQISTHAVVFIDGLCIIHTSVDTRGVVLRYSHNSLNSEEDVCDEPKDTVWGGEVGAGMGKFVVFNYYEGGKEGQDGSAVYDGVYVCTKVFLLRGMRWLED